MASRKSWRFLGIGFIGGVLGSAGFGIVVIASISFGSSALPHGGVVLSDIGCPSGMRENMSTSRCEMSKETAAWVGATLAKIGDLSTPKRTLGPRQVGDLADRTTGNRTLAFKLYRIAALMGDAESQYEVGGLLSKGNGAQEDDLEALRWLHEAAHNDHLAAQLRLVHMLSSGTFVKKDERLALRWLERAEAIRNRLQLTKVGA